MFAFTTLIKHSTGSPSHSNQTERRNKSYPNWKGGSKAVIIWRWHDIIPRKSYKLHQKLLDLINEFRKVAGYKINTQKSISFLFLNNELTEKLRKCHLLLQQQQQKRYLGINLTKEVKDLYSESYKTLKKETDEDTSQVETYTMFMDWKN